MPLLASMDAVKQMLEASGEGDSPSRDARLLRINASVSTQLQQMLGRSFGTAQAATSRVFTAGNDGSVLFEYPARSVTAVAVGGVWNGTVYTDSTALTVSQWMLANLDAYGRAYKLLQPYGGATVTVTGLWADSEDATNVPDDVQYAAAYLVAELYKQEQAGPYGFRSPDGSVARPINPWANPLVKNLTAYYGPLSAVTL